MEQPTTHQKPVHEYFCIKTDDQVTYIHALKYIMTLDTYKGKILLHLMTIIIWHTR